MSAPVLIGLMLCIFLAFGGIAMVFAGGNGGRANKRIASVSRGPSANLNAATRAGSDAQAQRRKNTSALIKDLEKQRAEKKIKLSLRKRIEQAGLKIEPRTFYLISAAAGIAAAGGCAISGFSPLVVALAAFAGGFGLPRWILGFLQGRRQKLFTNEFANAIDIIVRSVRSGLPTTEALKIVAREMPQPISGEFEQLVEGLKVGVTLEQGVKRMYERMPTAEVNFFGIVMTIQGRAGGNLSEALSNLSSVLRDRKRLQGKIKAMSSEAKASAGIIGSLPPGVAMLVYLSSPDYILPLFTTRSGNLMLAFCAAWMATGVFVMQRMINFKH